MAHTTLEISCCSSFNISCHCSVLCLALILYIPVNIFSIMLGRVFLGGTSTKQKIKCLAQGHNTVTPLEVIHELATPISPV